MLDKLLFVSKGEIPQEITQVIKSAGFLNIQRVTNGSEARRMLGAQPFSMVIINAPLEDEFGSDLSLFALDNNITNVILLVKSDIREAVESKLESNGVLVLPKPLSLLLLMKSLSIFRAMNERFENLLKKNRKLEDKIEELKLVDRAKCALIIHEHMSEEDAHKHIEKTAMNQRRTRKEIAKAVLEIYE